MCARESSRLVTMSNWFRVWVLINLYVDQQLPIIVWVLIIDISVGVCVDQQLPIRVWGLIIDILISVYVDQQLPIRVWQHITTQ